MRLQFWKTHNTSISFSHYLKCGAILFLFLLSVLVVACGSNGTDTGLGQPDVTVTIHLDQSNGSPTPPLPEYTCSAWTTNASPSLNTTLIGVYAKFVHNVDGNPQGVDQASATATVHWYDGSTVDVPATTTSDGLAVFPVSIANRTADLNKIIPVSVHFSKSGLPDCVVDQDRAAFFTIVIATGVVATASPSASATAHPTMTASPSPAMTPIPTICPTVKPRKTTPVPCF